MRAWRLVGALVVVGAAAAPARAIAESTTVPDPPVTCPAEPDLAAMPESMTLELDGLAAVAMPPTGLPSDHEQIEISWDGLTMEKGCVAVYRTSGPEADRFVGKPFARLGPQQSSWVHRSIRDAGEYCYNVVAVGENARGPVANVCASAARIAAPAGEGSVGWVVWSVLGLVGFGAVALLFLRRQALDRA